MNTVIAVSLNGKVELYTNGNHAYWTRPTTGAFRSKYARFAGRTLASALISLNIEASL